jgi:hypothetical protein
MSKCHPEVTPTIMPDGTTPVGVIYDCGKHDLVFF